MKKGSIALNLFGFSLAWLIVALVFTAFLLTNLYSRALEVSLSDNLEFHLETLAGNYISSNGENVLALNVADPRFLRPASGWYWQIKNQNGEIVAFSSSLVASVLPDISQNFDENNRRVANLEDGFNTEIRLVERKISLENSNIIISVSGNLDEIYQSVDNFRGQTLIVLLAVGIMLAIMSAIMARFALRPIGRISAAIEAIREGDASQIEGDYPKEIAPLADEVNELLSSNAQIIDRAKSQVGNLAHGLKTPLAVLRNEAGVSNNKLAKIVRLESNKMADMVSNYLNKAQMSARSNIVGRKSNALLAVERLVRVMQKLHPEKNIIVELQKSAIWFRGEESDFEEMAGNLIDNACKWAKSKVRVSLFISKDDVGKKAMLNLQVEDDGLGLSNKVMKLALRRGVRLDEKTSGSGLGLDIVKELVDIYAGNLMLSRSEMGGLKVDLSLPTVKS